MKTGIAKSDAELKEDILDELDFDPSINATRIGVIVNNGIVTLTGHVISYADKMAAEKVTKRVKGVKAVVNEMEVQLGSEYRRTDESIAQTALNNLKWNTNIPDDNVILKVANGWITLEGTVEWNYQKEAAKNAVDRLAGVRGVTNLIKVKPAIEPLNLKEKIKKSFERNADIDADNIRVVVEGHKVTLTGKVQSWTEKRQAEKVAWSAPGVTSVENDIEIKIGEPVF